MAFRYCHPSPVDAGAAAAFCATQSVQEEAACIARELRRLNEQGTPWREMGVVYTAPFIAEEVVGTLEHAKIPFQWLKDAKSKHFDPDRDCVRVMTAQSSKGLQYRVGVVAGTGHWPWRDETEEARLLYVAITRATDELVITSSKEASSVKD